MCKAMCKAMCKDMCKDMWNNMCKELYLMCKDTGCFFFHWYPPKKLKYGNPRLGESTLT